MKAGSWRGFGAIAGVLGLVAIVAAAAAGHGPSGGTSRPSTGAPHLVQDYLGTLALVMIPIGAVLVLWAALLRKSYKDVPLKSGQFPFMVRPRPFAWVLAFFIVLAIGLHFSHHQTNPHSGAANGGGRSHVKIRPVTPQYEPHFRWLPALVVGGLIFGIGGAMAVLTLRRRQEALQSESTHVALTEVLKETLDDLRRERNPRKAVIGAYAKMERALAARGLPRHDSEAPGEYLTRVLDIVSASRPAVQRLTSLFTRARFSPHEIDAAMKEEAIDALVDLRTELESAT